MSSSSSGFDTSSFNTPSVDSFDSTVKSTANSFNTALIVIVVISCIGTIAIVIAIIYCIKKCATSAPNYAQVTVGRDTSNSNNYKATDNPNFTVVTDSQLPEANRLPNFPVVTNSQLPEAAPMERFISHMAKQNPIRFTSQELAAFTRDYSTPLGSGGFSVVFKGDIPNGVSIAVKVLNKVVEAQFMAEVATIGRTHHINLVRLYGFCFDSDLQALVYEYMENGSLDAILFKHKPISWQKLHEIAIGTAKGIVYLHEECQQRIIHYDIKPANVLLDSNLSPKVADFGLAMLCNRDNTHIEVSRVKGTEEYGAPEVWMTNPVVTHKCDVYSFGILLLELVARRRHRVRALSGTSKEFLSRWVYEKVMERNEGAEMLAELGLGVDDLEGAERAAKVALSCVQYLPAARPNMSDVVRMLEGGMEIPPTTVTWRRHKVASTTWSSRVPT